MTNQSSRRLRAVRRIVSVLAEVIAEAPDRIVCSDPVRSGQHAYDVFRTILENRPTEEFWILLLDGKHHSIGLAQVSVGTLTSSLVHPREVFGPAVRMGAAAVIVAHNHPSGDPEPSQDDLGVTRRLMEAGKLLGIPVLDHLVCGRETYVSLRERLGFE